MKFEYNFKKEIPNFKERVANGDIFIPKELMKIKELKTNEKIYLAAYLNYNKSIIKADNYMDNMISKMSINSIKKHLIKLGYIENTNITIKNINDAKELTIQISHKGLQCEWCKQECYILHEHHFPIPKSKGGKNIVKICPNCHYTFHKIMSNLYYKED